MDTNQSQVSTCKNACPGYFFSRHMYRFHSSWLEIYQTWRHGIDIFKPTPLSPLSPPSPPPPTYPPPAHTSDREARSVRIQHSFSLVRLASYSTTVSNSHTQSPCLVEMSTALSYTKPKMAVKALRLDFFFPLLRLKEAETTPINSTGKLCSLTNNFYAKSSLMYLIKPPPPCWLWRRNEAASLTTTLSL